MTEAPKKPKFPIAWIVGIFMISFFILPVWLAAPEAAPIVTAVFVPFTVIAIIAVRYSQKEEEYQEHLEQKEKKEMFHVCEYCGTRFNTKENPEMCPNCAGDY